MSTRPLPDDPNLEQLKQQAKELRRAVIAGDAAAIEHVREHDAESLRKDPFPLSAAQLVLARHHGFTSWPKLKRHVELVVALTRAPDRVEARADVGEELIRLACLSYGDDDPSWRDQARALLGEHPEAATSSIHAAAMCANADAVRRFLAADPSLADAEGGPFRWTPLFHLAYARHDPDVSFEAVRDTARALLDAGADPNAGYLWHGLPSPFTVLTGVLGEGERGPIAQPRHPHWHALAELLLDAGAEANDSQGLYNRMFEPGTEHLELLFAHGLGRGDGGPWKRRLGDALDSPAALVHGQLHWAITHGMADRMRVLLAGGADPRAPFDDGATATDVAARNGLPAIVDLLVASGAPAPSLSPVDAFVGAALGGDGDAIEQLRAEHPSVIDDARAARPGLVTWAAANRRSDAVALLVSLGFDVNALGRSDTAIEQPWETGLHAAVANGDRSLVELLLSLGADPTVLDHRFSATPLGWAEHFGRPELVDLLEPLVST